MLCHTPQRMCAQGWYSRNVHLPQVPLLDPTHTRGTQRSVKCRIINRNLVLCEVKRVLTEYKTFHIFRQSRFSYIQKIPLEQRDLRKSRQHTKHAYTRAMQWMVFGVSCIGARPWMARCYVGQPLQVQTDYPHRHNHVGLPCKQRQHFSKPHAHHP